MTYNKRAREVLEKHHCDGCATNDSYDVYNPKNNLNIDQALSELASIVEEEIKETVDFIVSTMPNNTSYDIGYIHGLERAKNNLRFKQRDQLSNRRDS